MILAFVTSLGLLGLSGALIDAHRRSWHKLNQKADVPERTIAFAHAQYRRRLQASGMIGVIGALIGVWPIVPREPSPLAFYLALLLAGWFWIMLLAIIDFFATQRHYRRVRDEQLAAHLQLVLEMRAAAQSDE